MVNGETGRRFGRIWKENATQIMIFLPPYIWAEHNNSELIPEILNHLRKLVTYSWFQIKSKFVFLWKFCQSNLPSVKTLGILAKILHILTYSCLLLKLLIRSCFFLLHTNLLNFLIVFLVRVLSRVSRE